MADVKEKDKASISNSCCEEDVAQVVLTPATGSTTSKDEGNTRAGLQINQGDNKEKALTKAQAVREDAVTGLDEKSKEQINGDNLGGSLKGKGRKLRKSNKKNKVAQRASETVAGNGNEGNAIVAVNNALTVKEKAIGEGTHEDAAKEVLIEGEAKEKKNMEILGESSNGKGRKRARNRQKKVAQKPSEMVVGDGTVIVAAKNGVTIDNKEKAIGEEQKTHKITVNEAQMKGETEEKKNKDKLGVSSNGRGRRPRSNRKKRVAQNSSEMVVVDGDKPESSNRKKGSKKVESMGMVFMCSSKTKADCFRYKILGLPAGKKDQVAKIYKGMRLFLFDVDLRLMYGIFKATGAGGYNIEPKAFKSGFPSQVRFTVLEDCLPLAEVKFRNVIKENYYTRNKFECQLNAQQVKKLCNLFLAAQVGPSPKKAIRNSGSAADESRRDREKRKRRVAEEEKQPHPRSGRREQRRYHDFDYDYGQTPVRYEREARYLTPPPQDPTPRRPYGYETTYSYARDPVVDHRSYRVLETEPRHYDDIVSRDQDRYHIYSREEPPPIFRDNEYPYVDQYHHLPPPATALPSQYRRVSREYHPPPPAVRQAEYHLSGGLQARGYRDVGHTSDYNSSVPEYRHLQTRYEY